MSSLNRNRPRRRPRPRKGGNAEDEESPNEFVEINTRYNGFSSTLEDEDNDEDDYENTPVAHLHYPLLHACVR
jgi:hypothetical protein